MDDVRRISYDIMPKSLKSGGLVSAAEELLDKVRAQGILVESEIPDSLEILTKNEEVQIYRIIKELVNNSLKYANAALITLYVEKEDNLFRITFTDDGKGMDVNEALAHSRSKGLGLVSIQDRCAIMEAECDISSSPGNGFTFTLTKEIKA